MTNKMTVTLPLNIGNMIVDLETDVVEGDITLLLCKYSMNKVETTIDFSNDQIIMFGEKIFLKKLAKYGHYMILLFPFRM